MKPDFVWNRSETFSFKRPCIANSQADFQTFLRPWRVGVSVSNSLKDTHSIIMGSGTEWMVYMIRAVVISFFAWQKHLLKWKKTLMTKVEMLTLWFLKTIRLRGLKLTMRMQFSTANFVAKLLCSFCDKKIFPNDVENKIAKGTY